MTRNCSGACLENGFFEQRHVLLGIVHCLYLFRRDSLAFRQ
ncbi:hypothetical protein [Candidatus Similichlamydia laticola]|uniref:Uncharacterized protein n=1 Tax=Candidatus Similichlamydia laticola TaxID=2170265 RepID=A0A369KE08_9BACT|nr:hypothetical protein [Candidatus Similichlamydia laticola]RDB31690.1 hypothetical protein HAT2_00199 [Candidatus Similichlamydia laticola]